MTGVDKRCRARLSIPTFLAQHRRANRFAARYARRGSDEQDCPLRKNRQGEQSMDDFEIEYDLLGWPENLIALAGRLGAQLHGEGAIHV